MRVSAARAAPAAALLILTALSACDNVEWGGASVQIVTPPPAGGDVPAAPDPGTIAGLDLPRGAVLFHVTRTGGGARLVPVAEIAPDSLRTIRKPSGVAPEAYESRFRAAVMPVNAQFVLFRRGAEVGTLTVQAPAPATACGVPTAAGQAITVAAAAAETEFLAFRKGLAPDVIGEYTPPQVEGTIRRYGPLVAERLVLANGLQRPRSWTGAQRDLQALDAERGGHPEMAATFLVGDNLGLGAGEPDGWSVFYVASYEARTGYNPFYTEVRRYDRTGKAAPRLVDHLNWNERGGSELLVQVFGPRESWYEVISKDQGTWRRTWEAGRCIETPAPPRAREEIGAAERTAPAR